MRLTIYSRPGCHLCDEMKAVIRRVIQSRSDIAIDEIDISTDSGLIERYGLEIPVLLLDGKKIAKYRTTEEALARILESRVGWGMEKEEGRGKKE